MHIIQTAALICLLQWAGKDAAQRNGKKERLHQLGSVLDYHKLKGAHDPQVK